MQDIIQQSAKGELQVARLENAARQMSAFAQSNRMRQLASLMVARHSPAEELQELRELFSGRLAQRTHALLCNQPRSCTHVYHSVFAYKVTFLDEHATSAESKRGNPQAYSLVQDARSEDRDVTVHIFCIHIF